MVVYSCNICNYETTRKDNYNKHCLSKKHIINENKMNKIIVDFKCVNCDNVYKHQASLCRHNKKCIVKNIDSKNTEELKELVKVLHKKIENQNNQLDELNKQKPNTINIHNIQNIQNIQNNIQNNIQLLAYTDSDLSHLKDTDYKQCIGMVYNAIPKLIEKIHFNPLKPENMNIYIDSIKDKYVNVYDGKQWNKKLWREENEILIEDKKNILDEWIEENGDELLIQKYKKLKENIQIEECRDALKDRTRLLLYNKKNDIPKHLKHIE